MAEENQNKSYETTSEVEIKDCGVFDFFGNKKEEEKPQEVNVHGEPVYKVEEKKEEGHGEEKKQSLLEKIHRSNSSSSSSSDEEEIGEDGEKKKKKKEKKGLKEKIKEKITHDDDKEEKKHEDTTVPVEKIEVDPEHQKGFLEKIKDKLPGQHKKTDEVAVPPASSTVYGDAHTETDAAVAHEGEAKEKKGLLEKIKEKIPGYHPKSGEEKEKEKESGAY
uniref:Dehydrin n=1 Tax=Lupinus albus TaxID=3870 RepID=Q50H75_LUPAL|nr:dehydrin [Lupinus albus]